MIATTTTIDPVDGTVPKLPLGCENCPLAKRPRVPGVGRMGGLAITGERPGNTEILHHEPFVGISGRLLRQTLEAVGIDVKETWVTNVCQCHAPRNEPPTNEMIAACRPRLFNELHVVQPQRILALGATAFKALTGSKRTITASRGKRVWSDEFQCYIVPTFHPAYILRNPGAFRDFADDLMMIAKVPLGWEPEPEPPAFVLCKTPSDVRMMIRQIYSRERTHCSIDLETEGLDELLVDVMTVGIAASDHEIWIIPNSLMQNSFVRDQMKMLCEDSSLHWTGQNFYQFDAKFMRRKYKIDCRPDFDIMLAHYTLDERQGGHDLKTLSRVYDNAPEYAAEVKGTDFWNDPAGMDYEKLHQYQAWDLYETWRLRPIMDHLMIEDEVKSVHDDILIPGAHALGLVEENGVLIDRGYFEGLSKRYEQELIVLVQEMRETARDVGYPEWETFNPGSWQQIAKLLYDHLKIRTKTRATDKETLAEIKHPIAKQITQYRQTSKFKSTYVDGVLELLDSNGRLHGDFIIPGTSTGRLSARAPNLQNQPILSGPAIRNGYIATPGWVFWEADGAQMELRIIASYANDRNMIQAFKDKRDIHREVASVMYQLPPEQITKRQRYESKYVSFPVCYGATPESLQGGDSGWTLAQATAFYNKFMTDFWGIRNWIDHQHKIVMYDGYVSTLFGRKRRFPFINSTNKHDIEKQAVNTPVQGGASDVVFTALQRIVQRFDPKKQRVMMTIHDSIEGECIDDPVVREETRRIVYEEMVINCPVALPVPLAIEMKFGYRWGELEEIDLSDLEDEYAEQQYDRMIPRYEHNRRKIFA